MLSHLTEHHRHEHNYIDIPGPSSNSPQQCECKEYQETNTRKWRSALKMQVRCLNSKTDIAKGRGNFWNPGNLTSVYPKGDFGPGGQYHGWIQSFLSEYKEKSLAFSCYSFLFQLECLLTFTPIPALGLYRFNVGWGIQNQIFMVIRSCLNSFQPSGKAWEMTPQKVFLKISNHLSLSMDPLECYRFSQTLLVCSGSTYILGKLSEPTKSYWS